VRKPCLYGSYTGLIPHPHLKMASNSVVCCDCSTTNSPLWRRRDNGEIICNRCHSKQLSEVSQEEPSAEAKSRPITRRTVAKGDRGRARHHYQGKHSSNKSKCVIVEISIYPCLSPVFTVVFLANEISNYYSYCTLQSSCFSQSLPGLSSVL
jgi:hypothetical protein